MRLDASVRARRAHEAAVGSGRGNSAARAQPEVGGPRARVGSRADILRLAQLSAPRAFRVTRAPPPPRSGGRGRPGTTPGIDDILNAHARRRYMIRPAAGALSAAHVTRLLHLCFQRSGCTSPRHAWRPQLAASAAQRALRTVCQVAGTSGSGSGTCRQCSDRCRKFHTNFSSSLSSSCNLQAQVLAIHAPPRVYTFTVAAQGWHARGQAERRQVMVRAHA